MNKEVKVQVNTFITYGLCECGGRVRGCDGIVYSSYPPQYPHVCDKCGTHSHILGKHYPLVSYEEVEVS